MIKAITAAFLMGNLMILGNPDRISLSSFQTKQPNIIGHTHVFSNEDQTVQLYFSSPEKITATLFRIADNTLAPAGTPILITPAKNKTTPINISFPQSNKPTQYTLIFNTPDQSRLNITALPNNHLEQLRNITQKNPINLVNPPQGLIETLRQLGISSRIQNNPRSQLKTILIFFKKNHAEPVPKGAGRILIVSPTAPSYQEIWVSQKLETWRITVPHHYFNRRYLLTANGQAKRMRILLRSPENQ